ncbi:CAP domain-containing protein [Paracoccus sp. p1-h21]|uniref:CAP domain-containing protein n=1 Tax=Paracoccus sp. p1-h21 TaxID=3366951 RepID=UPI0037910ADB
MSRLLMVLFLFTGVFSAPAMSQPLGECLRAAPELAAALGRATNLMRHGIGLHRLDLDDQLNTVAQHHACDLARRQTISHTDRRGRTPLKRLRAMGFPACFSAENIAWGTRQPRPTIDAWQNSPAHRLNQQSRKATRMGFGQARGPDGRLYWVGLYARPCPAR